MLDSDFIDGSAVNTFSSLHPFLGVRRVGTTHGLGLSLVKPFLGNASTWHLNSACSIGFI